MEQHPRYPKFESSRLCHLLALGVGTTHSVIHAPAAQREGPKSEVADVDIVSIISTMCHASEYCWDNIAYVRALNPGKHVTILNYLVKKWLISPLSF